MELARLDDRQGHPAGRNLRSLSVDLEHAAGADGGADQSVCAPRRRASSITRTVIVAMSAQDLAGMDRAESPSTGACP
jgi:hypothetical protein